MKDLNQLNREINRALRATNQVAVHVAEAPLTNRAAALHEITQALVHIDAVQRMLFADDPSLEYHFDPNRAATPAMTKIAELVESAERLLKAGNSVEAAEMLQRACDLEPPPLAYEAIAKRLQELRGAASK